MGSTMFQMTWFAATTSASFSFIFSSSCGRNTCGCCCRFIAVTLTQSPLYGAMASWGAGAGLPHQPAAAAASSLCLCWQASSPPCHQAWPSAPGYVTETGGLADCTMAQLHAFMRANDLRLAGCERSHHGVTTAADQSRSSTDHIASDCSAVFRSRVFKCLNQVQRFARLPQRCRLCSDALRCHGNTQRCQSQLLQGL